MRRDRRARRALIRVEADDESEKGIEIKERQMAEKERMQLKKTQ